MRSSLAAALLAVLVLAGCKSDAEKLVDLRSDLRRRMDALYASYGGGALASGAREEAEAAGTDGRAGEGASTAARLLGQIDRAWFEGYCLAHGRGERPFDLSAKLEAFMRDPDHQEACAKAAKLDLRIRELEARTAAEGR